MNPGQCKKCGAAIVWVPRREGGWMRPMERIDERLDQGAYDDLHGQEIFLLADGELTKVRVSSLLTWHSCPAEIEQRMGPDSVVLGATGEVLSPSDLKALVTQEALALLQSDQQRDVLARERVARDFERHVRQRAVGAHFDERQEARARQGEALVVPCPYCEEPAGQPCANMSVTRPGAKARFRWTRRAHQDRIDLAVGTGAMEAPPWETPQRGSLREHVLPERVGDRMALREWLRVHSDIWSDIWTGDVEANLNLFGNHDEALVEAETGN